jgi:hypothetical protein
MNFNKNYIFILFILGVILLYSYYYFLKNNKDSMKLWGKINGNLLKIYYISMLLSAFGFLCLFYYLITTNVFTKENIIKLFISLIGIIVISILWMPLSLNYLRNKNNITKFLIIFVLLAVSICALYLLNILYNINDSSITKNIALVGMTYFFIHAFLFDFIIWNLNFF